MQEKIKTEIKIALFISFCLVVFFTLLYKYYAKYSNINSLHTALSYQTFAGTTVTDHKGKIIANFQMIVTYIFIIGVLTFDVFG